MSKISDKPKAPKTRIMEPTELSHLPERLNIVEGEKKDQIPWISLSLLLMALVGIVLMLRQPMDVKNTDLSSKMDLSSKEALRLRVNSHLQTSALLYENRAVRRDLENQAMTGKIRNEEYGLLQRKKPREALSYGINFAPETEIERVLSDLDDSPVYDTTGPVDRINAILKKKQYIADYDHNYRMAYIREFVRKAREDGYDLKINDKLEVVEMVPIPKDGPYRGYETVQKVYSTSGEQ